MKPSPTNDNQAKMCTVSHTLSGTHIILTVKEFQAAP